MKVLLVHRTVDSLVLGMVHLFVVRYIGSAQCVH
jgi:hypothetical protein